MGNALQKPPSAGPLPLRAWVRCQASPARTYAFRFEVDEGRAVLRVARPGVLIVPPARTRGHEEQLSADQLRSSVLLYVPSTAGLRRSCALSQLDDTFLSELEVEVWTELRIESRPDANQDLFLPPVSDTVISLAGAVEPEPSAPGEPSDLAQIIERVSRQRLDDDELSDEVIEAGDDATSPSQASARPRRRSPGPTAPGTTGRPTIESEPPPVHPPVLSPGSAPSPVDAGRPDAAPQAAPSIHLPSPQPAPHLARHLRRQLERKDQEIIELRARLAELERLHGLKR